MTKLRTAVLLLSCLVAFAGCATGQPADRQRGINMSETRSALGCEPDEIALCVDVDCQPEDYVCISKTDFRRVFGSRAHN